MAMAKNEVGGHLCPSLEVVHPKEFIFSFEPWAGGAQSVHTSNGEIDPLFCTRTVRCAQPVSVPEKQKPSGPYSL
jgi:hypothetical protein